MKSFFSFGIAPEAPKHRLLIDLPRKFSVFDVVSGSTLKQTWRLGFETKLAQFSFFLLMLLVIHRQSLHTLVPRTFSATLTVQANYEINTRKTNSNSMEYSTGHITGDPVKMAAAKSQGFV